MSIDSDSISYILFYTLACLGSLLMPLLFFRRSRIICMRRIRERRWRVRVDDIEGEEVIIPRYSPDDPRYNPSKEEALETKKAYVLQQLGSCSMVLKENDFIQIDDINKGIYKMNNENMSCSKKSDQHQLVHDQDIPITAFENNDGTFVSNLISNHDLEVGLCEPIDEEQCVSSTVTFIKISSAAVNQLIRTECSVCLLDFQVGDHISWSPLSCSHVFHRNCILKWMLTLMERNDEQRARRSQKLSLDCDFQIPCPVCRTDFIPHTTKSSTDCSHSVSFPVILE